MQTAAAAVADATTAAAGKVQDVAVAVTSPVKDAAVAAASKVQDAAAAVTSPVKDAAVAAAGKVQDAAAAVAGATTAAASSVQAAAAAAASKVQDAATAVTSPVKDAAAAAAGKVQDAAAAVGSPVKSAAAAVTTPVKDAAAAAVGKVSDAAAAAAGSVKNAAAAVTTPVKDAAASATAQMESAVTNVVHQLSPGADPTPGPDTAAAVTVAFVPGSDHVAGVTVQLEKPGAAGAPAAATVITEEAGDVAQPGELDTTTFKIPTDASGAAVAGRGSAGGGTTDATVAFIHGTSEIASLTVQHVPGDKVAEVAAVMASAVADVVNPADAATDPTVDIGASAGGGDAGGASDDGALRESVVEVLPGGDPDRITAPDLEQAKVARERAAEAGGVGGADGGAQEKGGLTGATSAEVAGTISWHFQYMCASACITVGAGGGGST